MQENTEKARCIKCEKKPEMVYFETSISNPKDAEDDCVWYIRAVCPNCRSLIDVLGPKNHYEMVRGWRGPVLPESSPDGSDVHI